MASLSSGIWEFFWNFIFLIFGDGGLDVMGGGFFTISIFSDSDDF